MSFAIALSVLMVGAPPLFFSKPAKPTPAATPVPTPTPTPNAPAAPSPPAAKPAAVDQNVPLPEPKTKPLRRAVCKRHRGETVCGFGCLTKYNKRRCAKTPAGVCYAARGDITCWDPPNGIGNVPGVPKACCFERVGSVQCGYNCVESGRDMKCSAFPTGVCQDHRGDVKCWDPPPLYAVGSEKAECVEHNGDLVCGFNCEKRAGDAQCAQTPNGVCRTEGGAIVCWDPRAR